MDLEDLIRENRRLIGHDTEFRHVKGERVYPWSEAWREGFGGRDRTQVLDGKDPKEIETPYDPDRDFVVLFNGTAEGSVNRALGREQPRYVIDLYAEFCRLTNGLGLDRRSLLKAMEFFGLPAMESVEKKKWHERFIETTGPFPEEWWPGALAYNLEDVIMTEQLLEAMAPKIDLAPALLRGAYAMALADIEYTGIPIDVDLYHWMQEHWDEIKRRLIDACPLDVFDGLSFNFEKFAHVLEHELRVTYWARTETGTLRTDSKYLERMSFEYPEISSMHRVKRTLDTFKHFELAVGRDGRNRAWWNPYGSLTGRNQPKRENMLSNHSRYIRGLITPGPGRAIAELDYEQQEYAIAGALSEDPRMIANYLSGDPYIAMAVQAGDAPEGASKRSHPEVRADWKVTALSVQFGSTGHGIARRLGKCPADGCELLRKYDDVHRVFRQWQLRKRVNARYGDPMVLPYGWRVLGGPSMGWRTIDNYWMQGTGSEMLRAAVVKLRQAGITLIGLIHDAVLIESDDRDIEDAVRTASRIMSDVSEHTLQGRIRIRVDSKIIRHGERLLSSGAMPMWNLVTGPYFEERGGC